MLNIQVGNQFVQENRTLEVLSFSNHEIVFKKNTADNTFFDVMKIDELLGHIGAGNIRPKIKSLPAPVMLKPHEEAKFQQFAPYLQVMQELASEQLPITTQQAYKQVLRIVEARHPKVSFAHPSRSALAKYYKALSCVNDMRALFVRRGHGGKCLEPWQERTLEESIQRNWIEARSENRLGAYRRYCHYCKQINQKPVSRSTYFRRIHQLPVFEKNYLHSDKAGRNSLLACHTRSIETNRLLERVEIDRCVLDLSVFDNNVTTRSIAVYAAIDAHSRVLLGLTITYNQNEDTDGVMELLHQLHLNRPELPYTGKIDTIFRDNGPGFKAHVITDTLESLGIAVINTPPNQPQKKPFIESFFKTMANFLMDGMFQVGDETYQGVPGYLGVIPKKSGIKCSREAKQRATLTRAAFEKIMKDLVLYYNTNWPHSEIRMTPNEKWEEQIMLSPIIPVEYQYVKNSFHYMKATATLQKGGIISLLNQTFSNDETVKLYNTLRITNDGQNPQVSIRYNPLDATSISLFDNNGQRHVLTNTKLKDLNTPRSFNEIQRRPLPSATLFTVNVPAADAHEPAPKEPKNDPHKNKKIPSYDEARERNLDTKQQIQNSHQEYKDLRKKQDSSTSSEGQEDLHEGGTNFNSFQPFDERENW